MFNDTTRAPSASSAHVLVVGVGHYGAAAGLAELTSSTRSAREIAGWFLRTQGDGITPLPAPEGFANGGAPLGSLAILLSEGADRAATFAGIDVPRATSANLKLAFGAWLARATGHRDNIAILYLCGHGLRDEKHTAFILEDRDSASTTNLVNGLIGLDVLADLMKRQPVRSQLLLFDCCRSNISLGLPDRFQIGTDLLPLAAMPGPDIEQMAMFAAQPGMEARGRMGRNSLFAESLIAALGHAGASKMTGSWIVSSLGIFRAMDSYLELFARSEHQFQRMDASALADFPIHQASISASEVHAYISLADPSLWEKATILVQPSSGLATPLAKPAGQRFIATKLKRDEPVSLIADWGNGTSSLPVEPDRPVLFARIGAPSLATVAAAPLPVSRGINESFGAPFALPDPFPMPFPAPGTPGDGAIFDPFRADRFDAPRGGTPAPRRGVVILEHPRPTELAVVATSSGSMPAPAGIVTVQPGDDAPPVIRLLSDVMDGIAVAPGRHRVALALPDGRSLQETVMTVAGKKTTVTFDAGGSPHEWLATAAAAGVLPLPLRDQPALRASRPLSFTAELRMPLRFEATAATAEDVGARLGDHAMNDGAVARLDIVELVQKRFRREPDGSVRARPLWLRCAVDGLAFDVAVPTPGMIWTDLGWRPHLVAVSYKGSQKVTALAEPGPAAPLFAFLGRRDFGNAAIATAALLAGSDRAAIVGSKNPLVSAAVAIAALASRYKAPGLSAKWHDDFAGQHPSLPDAAIIAARRLWNDDAFSDRPEVMRAQLETAYSAGVPVFGIALDWLAHGLSLFDDDDARGMAKRVRAVAQRTIQGQLFTTLRAIPGED
ncbi:caspase family protein (plasmid) [Bosea vestrisii]|uniref:caspase family protein n=1 Tax=Bosea vestrisii TaxID=151416 RepID=UPI0024DF311B|nr:caspase family protein [Bosea vestrisii]WID99682.1 caspase family protein [Bosea vestrisii]